jgi:hypothetical protein
VSNADVTARLDLGGNKYVGTSLARSNAPIEGTFKMFVEHAEGDVFAQALRTGGDYAGDSGMLYVSRLTGPSGFCRSGISAVARSMDLSELIIATPRGVVGAYTPETGLVMAPWWEP